eukprot:2570863-Lingulodinium_polyedra.AAC.1
MAPRRRSQKAKKGRRTAREAPPPAIAHGASRSATAGRRPLRPTCGLAWTSCWARSPRSAAGT